MPDNRNTLRRNYHGWEVVSRQTDAEESHDGWEHRIDVPGQGPERFTRLSDAIRWAKEHDADAYRIGETGGGQDSVAGAE